MDRWQYQTVRFDLKGFMGGILDLDAFQTELNSLVSDGWFQSELNSLGADGWELVSCFDTNMSQGQSRYVIAVFKRKY